MSGNVPNSIAKKVVMAGQAKRDPATQGHALLGGRVKPGHDGLGLRVEVQESAQ